MEAHTTVLLEATRRGLADVVQQGSETEHEVWSGHGRGGCATRSLQGDGLLEHDQRVLKDVLVPMMLVDLELERRELRQHVLGKARLDEQHEALARGRAHDQLDELVANSLDRDDIQGLSLIHISE